MSVNSHVSMLILSFGCQCGFGDVLLRLGSLFPECPYQVTFCSEHSLLGCITTHLLLLLKFYENNRIER